MKKLLVFSILSFLFSLGFSQLKENVGIGVRLQTDSTRGYKIPRIIALVPNGNAQAAGLQEGDFIMKVNEQSTRDMKLAKVVEMIVGEEGTEVNLNIERHGSMFNYTIMRGKYQYATSYYMPVVNDNDFCTALATLMNDAPYNFIHTMDTVNVDENEDYKSKVKVPGVEKVLMQESFSISCIITIGHYSTQKEVNVAGADFIEQLKVCFPEYYYEAEMTKDGNGSVNIGKTFSNGYESPIVQLYSFQEKGREDYTLIMRVNPGKADRYYTTYTAPNYSSLYLSLKTIYDDIQNNFNKVKGTKHQNEGGPFSSGSWYEVEPLPDGALSCSVSEGGMSVGAKGCNCGYYNGTNRTEAVELFNKLYDDVVSALGNDFVHTFDHSEWDKNIPENAESAISFAIKKKNSYESDLPKIVIMLAKGGDNKYYVSMMFYKFGM